MASERCSRFDKTGKGTVLYNLGSAGSLVLDKLGNLYGTTVYGGNRGQGSVFKIDRTGKETDLYDFTGAGGDGSYPKAGFVRDTKGNLYGTTQLGGDLTCMSGTGCGTVFKVDATGHETVLYKFTGTGSDGANPVAALVRDTKGNLYGTTPSILVAATAQLRFLIYCKTQQGHCTVPRSTVAVTAPEACSSWIQLTSKRNCTAFALLRVARTVQAPPQGLLGMRQVISMARLKAAAPTITERYSSWIQAAARPSCTTSPAEPTAGIPRGI